MNLPADLDFGLYFNLAFLSILGLGILFGFLRGFKKALWVFVVSAIFIAFFFLTIDKVVNILWTLNMPFLGGALQSLSPELSSVTSLAEALPILLGQVLPADFASTATNVNFLEFTTSIALFVVKIVYAILYFTVIQILYRLILWILKMIISPSKKKTDKYKSKNRGLGAVFGLLQGSISLLITLIMFGGLMSISESVANIMPDPVATPIRQIEYRSGFRDPGTSMLDMAAFSLPDVGGLDEAYDMLNNMVEGYNSNIIVTYQNKITMTDPYDAEGQIPLNLYLFDSVLSMNYQGEQIAIRAELNVLTNVIGEVMNSDFMESGDVGDITGDEIRGMFTELSHSNIFTTILPLGIEVASEAFDVPLEIPVADLYAIEWDTEIMQLGEIAATAMDIVNAAGILNGTMDLNTITLDGDDIEELFDNLGESELITLAAYVAIEPILEMAGENIQAFITVPADLDWSAEFTAIGALAGEILNAGLTIGAVESGDIGTILPLLANIDFTVLLQSQIITNAMINILSGETSIDISAFITVPDGIQWLNEVVDGVTVYGELYNILLAINALAESASGIDFSSIQNLSLDTIAQFTADDINALFESKILVATITTYIDDLELGESFPIVMPDSVFDENGYLLKEELQNIVGAVFMLVNELACPIGDVQCLELGVNIDAIFTLDGDNIDTLLLSKVLSASAGSLIVDLGGDMLTVPGSAMSSILVDTVATDVVSKAEIKAAFLAISALGITGIDDIAIDPSILTNLAVEGQPTVLDTDKSDLLFGSVILNATLSSYLIDFATGESSLIVVPYFAEDNTTVIRVIDAVDGTEYISEAELTNILEAVLILDIQDFEAIDSIDIGEILSNVSALLGSSILHATVSKQLLDLTDVVVVPLNDSNGDPLKITVGTGEESSMYIAKEELEHAFDALSVLGITDINNVAIDLTILTNLALEGQPTELDTAKSTKLFSSSIINATLAKYLLDFTEGAEALVVVPYEDQDGNIIRTTDVADGTEYIVELELTNILKAVLVLDIQDFNAIDTIDIGDILTNVGTLLDSAILHATISKQLLDLTDVVVVPTKNELGDLVKITTGPIGHLTTFIEKDELEYAFDALEVLGITDINNVAMDMSILTNLAEEDDSTALDSVKATTLFSSAVINATLSKYIIDFSSGDDPFLVVPDKDQNGTAITVTGTVDGIVVIKESELRHILKAILILDLQSFDSVESLGLDTILGNVSTILDSSIMHASISKQFIDLGTDIVVIPDYYENDDPLIITQGTVDYIDRDELEATFDALNVLGMTDISNMTVDITSILNNLGEELDPTVLDNSKATTLFGSTILKATIAKYILDFSEGATPILQVPQKDEADDYIKTVSLMDGTKYITQTELTNVLGAILALGLSDFDNVSTLSLDTIIDNKSAILSSTILQATVSQQLIDLGVGAVIIPEFEEDNATEVLITRGDAGQEMTFIAKLELEDLFDALEVLGIGDLDGFDGGVDLSVLDQPGAVNTLVQSAILQATISDQILALAGGGGATLVVIPYETPDGGTVLRRMIGSASPVEMIKQTELGNLIDAFVALGFTDVDNLELSISISTLTDNASVIFESYTIQATVSNQVLDLESPTIIIPYYDDNLGTPTRLRNISGLTFTPTEYIDKDELIALMAALDVLIPEGDGVSGFDGSVDISLFYDDGPRTILLTSYILQATISKQIADLGAAIEVPTQRDDGTVIRLTAGIILAEQNEYLVDDEIHALFEALELLGMDDINDFDGNNLTFDIFLPSYGVGVDYSYLDNQTTLLASACIQATVSKQIIDLAVGDTLIIPAKNYSEEDVRLLVAGTDYIVVSEIKSLFNALDVLELDINNFSGNLGLTNLFESTKPLDYTTNQTVMLNSAIMHATMSNQIYSLSTGATPAILIPTTDKGGLTFTKTVETVYFIQDTEIKNLLNAMDAMGFGSAGNLGDFGGTVNFSNLSDSGKQETMLDSIIMHSTISDKIFDLSQGATPAIIIPTTNFDDEAVHVTVLGNYFIEKLEIKALLDAMNVLGVGGDLGSFGGTIGLTNLFKTNESVEYKNNQVTVLASAIMHRTITNQIIDLGVSALTVPDTDIDGLDIDADISTNFFITKDEIKHLFDAMDVLGVTGDLGAFDGDIDLTRLADEPSQTTLLLSAIMHATLSDKLINTTLDIPDTDINRLVLIRVPQSGTEFIENTEIKALLVSLDMLGLTNFGSMGLDITAIYDKDLTILLASATMQATMSGEILPQANTYALASSGDFIIPGALREDIFIETVAAKWIEKAELIELIEAFETMDLPGFNVNIDSSRFSAYNKTEIHEILESVSMHLTIEKMIQANSNVNAFIPDVLTPDVVIDSYYTLTDIVSPAEVELFILAVNVLGGDISGDITTASLSGLTVPQQETVLASYITRSKLSFDLAFAMTTNGDAYEASDYEIVGDAAPVCIKYASALEALAYL